MEEGATIFVSALDVGARAEADICSLVGEQDVSGLACDEEQARHDEELRLATCARQAGDLWSRRQDHLECLRAIGRRLNEGNRRAAVDLLERSEDVPGEVRSAIRSRVENRPVASLLLGKAGGAQRLGVRLELDPDTRLRRLPPGVDESAAVSIVGNLIQNAVDAVQDLPRQRRRVRVVLSDAGGGLRIRVRDWGRGLGDAKEEALLSPGFSTKQGHSGVGLAIVDELAAAAGGTLTIERPPIGTVFDVMIPDG